MESHYFIITDFKTSASPSVHTASLTIYHAHNCHVNNYHPHQTSLADQIAKA